MVKNSSYQIFMVSFLYFFHSLLFERKWGENFENIGKLKNRLTKKKGNGIIANGNKQIKCWRGTVGSAPHG